MKIIDPYMNIYIYIYIYVYTYIYIYIEIMFRKPPLLGPPLSCANDLMAPIAGFEEGPSTLHSLARVRCSHVSVSVFIRRNCEWLINTDIIYVDCHSYMDNWRKQNQHNTNNIVSPRSGARVRRKLSSFVPEFRPALCQTCVAVTLSEFAPADA